MEKKFIEEMNNDELTKVYHANEKLRNDIYEDMVETEMHFISEQLDSLRGSLSDWSIGVHNRNYMHIRDEVDFIEGIRAVENSIPVLNDEDLPLLDEAETLIVAFNSVCMIEEDEEAERLEGELERVANELKEIVIARFMQSLDGCDNEEHQIDYFIEFYSDARLEADECYIDSEDYVLKEDTTRYYN